MATNIEVVLVNPEIPQNTGNILRTCVGLGIRVNLIEPLGFKIDDKKLRRSAVDYYDSIDMRIYESLGAFISENKGKYYYLTRYANKSYSEIDFKEDSEPIYLFFGSESYGIDRELLAKNFDNTFRIPTNDKIRSLNLSNTVAIVLYEAMRQNNFTGLELSEPESLKGSDYLRGFKTDGKEDK